MSIATEIGTGKCRFRYIVRDGAGDARKVKKAAGVAGWILLGALVGALRAM